MARTALLDINVLVALFHPEHVHHDLAHDWFADHRAGGWATCPITVNGFVRVVGQLGSGDVSLRPQAIVEHLRRFCEDDRHQFWATGVSLTDATVFQPTAIRGPRQVTDVYLLGLACAMKGCLVTFDGSIPRGAVVNATRDNLVIITA